MPDYNLLDEIDIISSDLKPGENKLISKYLKAYKAKQTRSTKLRPFPSPRTKLKAKVKR